MCQYSRCWQVKWVVVAAPCQVCCDNWDVWLRFKPLADDGSFLRMNGFSFFYSHHASLQKKKKGPLCTEASRVKPPIVRLHGTWRRRSSDSVKEMRKAEMRQQLWMYLCVLLLMFVKEKGGRQERGSAQKGISCWKMILIEINTNFSS